MEYVNRWQRLMPIAASVLAISGCVGTIDRNEFNTEVQRRGGGLSTVFVDESLQAIAAEVGAVDFEQIEIVTLTITPSRRSVAAQVRRPDQPEFLDAIIANEGRVVAVTPVQDADELPLDELTVAIRDLPLDDVEALGDQALAEFGDPGGFIAAIRVSLIRGTHIVNVDVESSRRTATFQYDLAGNPQGEKQ